MRFGAALSLHEVQRLSHLSSRSHAYTQRASSAGYKSDKTGDELRSSIPRGPCSLTFIPFSQEVTSLLPNPFLSTLGETDSYPKEPLPRAIRCGTGSFSDFEIFSPLINGKRSHDLKEKICKWDILYISSPEKFTFRGRVLDGKSMEKGKFLKEQ